MTIYLDHAATTTIRPVALEALDDAYARFDRNASGLHAEAREAKNALEDARERAASLLGTERPHDIIFTGSGTESDNLAVIGASLASEGKVIAVSAIEHKAVLKAAESLTRFGYTVDTIPARNPNWLSSRSWRRTTRSGPSNPFVRSPRQHVSRIRVSLSTRMPSRHSTHTKSHSKRPGPISSLSLRTSSVARKVLDFLLWHQVFPSNR